MGNLGWVYACTLSRIKSHLRTLRVCMPYADGPCEYALGSCWDNSHKLKILAVAITSGKFAMEHVPANIRRRESKLTF